MSGSASAMFVDPTAGAVEHCETMSKALGQESPLVTQYYQPICRYCQEKLWHQLTVTVLDFVHDAAAANNTDAAAAAGGVHPYLALYDKVVLAVDRKLDPLQLSRIAAAVALALQASDVTAAKAVLENLLQHAKAAAETSTTATGDSGGSSNNNNKFDLGPAATIYVQSRLALQQLQTGITADTTDPTNKQALDGILQQIRTNQATLRSVAADDQQTPALVHAAHYEQAMTYYKVVGPPEAFFEQAMHFLHYAPVPTTTSEAESGSAASSAAASSSSSTNYHQLAVDLILAALTGEGVYNLSQVVQEQAALLQLLQQPDNNANAWLVDLLTACAAGQVETFQKLTVEHAAAVAQQPALVHRAAAVQEKLTLLALVDLIFQTPSHERLLSFEQVAAHCHCTDIDQVEWILMRALSVHLMEGRLDQVSQQVHVTWVIPTTLHAQQLHDLGQRFGEWAGKVQTTKASVQEQTATFA